MTFTPCARSGQQRPQRLVQRRVGDPEIAALGVDDVLDVVQQHDHPAGREGVQQRPHQRRRGLVRIAVALQQPVRGFRREQPAQVSEQVREVHRVRPGRAQVDDPVHRQLAQVVGQPAALQRLEQPAHHRGLAHPAPPDHRHDPGVVGPQEVADQLGLHVPVLEVGRRDDRRRVHELAPAPERPTAARAAAPAPARRRSAPRSAGSPPRGRPPAAPARRPARAVPRCPARSAIAAPGRPAAVPARPRPADSADPAAPTPGCPSRRDSGAACASPASKPPLKSMYCRDDSRNGKLGIGIHAQRDDRLLVLQRPYPLGLAGRMILHAVPGHDEQQARAGLDRVPDLSVPVHARLLVAHVQPHRVRGRPGGQMVGEPPGEPGGIAPRVTDEKTPVHPHHQPVTTRFTGSHPGDPAAPDARRHPACAHPSVGSPERGRPSRPIEEQHQMTPWPRI